MKASTGESLRAGLLDRYELADHEVALLDQAVATLDAINLLQGALDKDGPIVESPQGCKAHPALPELRQQRVVFARLLAQLAIPTEDDAQPSRRAARGSYKLRAVEG